METCRWKLVVEGSRTPNAEPGIRGVTVNSTSTRFITKKVASGSLQQAALRAGKVNPRFPKRSHPVPRFASGASCVLFAVHTRTAVLEVVAPLTALVILSKSTVLIAAVEGGPPLAAAA